MKRLFRAIIFLAMAALLIGCGQVVTPTPSLIPSPTTTATTLTSIPTQTATATVTPKPRPEYVPPTLIPTIDPTLMPGLLSKAFSIQALEDINGHTLRQITGWDFGFGNIMYPYYCPGHAWLDPSHLLLYPVTGQEPAGQGRGGMNLVPQPVVINLENGVIWLPPVQTENYRTCHKVYSSPELGILVHRETKDDSSIVSTYTYDGRKLTSYPGRIIDISPSGTKILLAEDTLLDLRTNRLITLNWSLEDYNQFDLTGLFWTSDEKRVYRCCYFYADLATGTSHRFERSDFQFTDGIHLDPDGLWFYRGQWVRNDTYFLVEWSWVDDGDIRYLPMFEPTKKIFYDVREMAGISEDWHSQQTSVSPDGAYVWMTGWGEREEGSYLVNLFTFDAHYFPGKEYLHIDWASNSKFAWIYDPYPTYERGQYLVLSVADKVIRLLAVKPLHESEHWWHPTEAIVVYPSVDNNMLIFLDAATMDYRKLPFTLLANPYAYGHVAWNPKGEKLALLAEDGSVWQVDYPNLEYLEQLTPSLPDVTELNWSPDGSSLSFISGSDIYIVETTG